MKTLCRFFSGNKKNTTTKAHSYKLLIATLAIPSLFLFSNAIIPQTAHAASRVCTWEGDISGNSNWDAGTVGVDTNWNCTTDGQSIPQNTDELVFPSGPSQKTTNNNIAGLTINSLAFSDGYTINGQAFSLMYGFNVSGSTGVTINPDINLAANQVWTVNSTMLSLNGVLSGTGNVGKAGDGGVHIYGNNTYTGTTTISGGYIGLHNQNGFGATSAGTTIGSTATLNLYISGMTIGEPFNIQGFGNVGGGAIRNFSASGTNTISGNITLANDTEIHADTTNNLVLSGVVSGPSDKTLYLKGNVELAGANTFTGTVYITDSLAPAANITVSDTLLATVEMHGGTLNANSIVNKVKMYSGSDANKIKPRGDNAYGSISIIDVSASAASTYYCELGNGVRDYIETTGTVNLNNISLNIALNYDAAPGTEYLIFGNYGGTLSGTFSGLTDGTTFISGGSFPKLMKINYIAGVESTEIKVTVMNSILPTVPVISLPITTTPTDSVTPTSTLTPTVGSSITATTTPTGQVLGATTTTLSDTGAAVPVIILGTSFITSIAALLYIHREKLKNLNFKRK